jgi:hypothetical protein
MGHMTKTPTPTRLPQNPHHALRISGSLAPYVIIEQQIARFCLVRHVHNSFINPFRQRGIFCFDIPEP